MQLEPGLWLEGAYYVDFDTLGQLRVVGPNNHLHFASVGLYQDQISIDSFKIEHQDLVIEGHFLAKELFLHDPVMGHIQKVRHFTEKPGEPQPAYEQVVKKEPIELAPNYIGLESSKGRYHIDYKRLYKKSWYGVVIKFEEDVKVLRQERKRGFKLEAAKGEKIAFTMTAKTYPKPRIEITNVMKEAPIDLKVFGKDSPKIDALLNRTHAEITHLVSSNKTSGFEYGTVFPRDWMESADLGTSELLPEAIHYMYAKAFEYVSPQGIGWHENIIGEFEFEKRQETRDLSATLDDLVDQSSRIGTALKDLINQIEDMYVIRNMIDIEPRYLVGLENIPTASLGKDDLERIRRVASYIVMQAQTSQLVTFKKLPTLMRRHKHDEYFAAGNWRDSQRAFKMVHPIIAPYDVNAVFYPKALAVISRMHRLLGVDKNTVDQLIKKWARVKEWYKFTNKDGTSAYALALYDVKTTGSQLEYKKLEVNHLDEAYGLFYGCPAEADVVSFCKRLVDSNYFYTPSGPVVIGKQDGYSTTDYHGEVIWTKQTAFVVAGLAKQLENEKFSLATKKLIKEAVNKTAQASIEAFLKLGCAPELHYDKNGQPRLYNDQPKAEGPMNKVQLWSAVGARRIIREYVKLQQDG